MYMLTIYGTRVDIYPKACTMLSLYMTIYVAYVYLPVIYDFVLDFHTVGNYIPIDKIKPSLILSVLLTLCYPIWSLFYPSNNDLIEHQTRHRPYQVWCAIGLQAYWSFWCESGDVNTMRWGRRRPVRQQHPPSNLPPFYTRQTKPLAHWRKQHKTPIKQESNRIPPPASTSQRCLWAEYTRLVLVCGLGQCA